MAKGGRGGKRGGTGGVKPGEIKGTHNLHIDTALDDKTRGEVTSVLHDFNSKYGIETNNTRIAQMSATSSALAYYDYEGIAINSKYLNSDTMNKAYQQCVASGFHPSSGNKTGLEAVVAHELGHHVNDVVAGKMGLSLDASAERIVTKARKMTGDKGNIIFGSKISGYAKSSNAETIAEAFADHYCNGRKAKAQSKAIVKVVDSYFKPAKKTKSDKQIDGQLSFI